MKTAFLSLVAAGSVTVSAYGLTIIPTFDASITNDVNAAAMTNAIYHAIRVEQSNFVNNVTLKIHFTNDPSIGLGQSTTWGNNYNYATFLTALRASATSRNDTNGYSKIPNTTTDPLVGNNIIYLTKAAGRLLGLTATYGPDGFDSTISLKMSLMNFTRPPSNPLKYDLAQVAEHEIDEVMGCSSDLPDLTEISPIDLFRYTTNLVRTYTTTGDNAYFSADGTNLLARFNMNSGGDYSDWWSFDNNWRGNQIGNFPQVQDAFSQPGNAFDMGTNEQTMLDLVGWTLAATVTPTVSPSLKIVRSGANQYTLSWTNTATGFVLQENTNLLAAAAWVNSATGATNPAIINSGTARKFYRLYKAASFASLSAEPETKDLATSPPRTRVHVTRARQN